MYREGIKSLKEWKLNKNTKPLVFLGARQVGKTWLTKLYIIGNYLYEEQE
jgi:predicted AAA+ superfamily ATPase